MLADVFRSWMKWVVACSLAVPTSAQASSSVMPQMDTCRKVVMEGEVRAGQGYEQVFATGLKFMLEPLRSGWIVRVLASDKPRRAHDYAELASPPYQSVSPLLISTDWSFRSQDAVAWNPRRFQYSKNEAVFQDLEALMSKVMAGDGASSAKLAGLVAEQPQGTLQIMDAQIVPGLANQSGLASSVASHLGTTPHSVDTSGAPSPLGSLRKLHFRVELQLPDGIQGFGKIRDEACPAQPTGGVAPASQHIRTRTGR
jgi:hypothetical protein